MDRPWQSTQMDSGQQQPRSLPHQVSAHLHQITSSARQPLFSSWHIAWRQTVKRLLLLATRRFLLHLPHPFNPLISLWPRHDSANGALASHGKARPLPLVAYTISPCHTNAPSLCHIYKVFILKTMVYSLRHGTAQQANKHGMRRT